MRKNVHRYTCLNAVNAAVTQTSSATVVDQVDYMSYHCKFSGNVSGSFKVEAQNSDQDSWYELNFGAALTLTSENECQILINEIPFQNVRLVWTPVSAAGQTLTAILTMKSKGA